MYKRILIATDGSELSDKAVSSGVALAASLGAEVFAVSVVPPYPSAYFDGSFAMTSGETNRIESQWRAHAHERVEAVKSKAVAQGVTATTVVVTGNAAQGIISAAKKHECDLIVMASHGRKGIERLLLGSETLDTLTHSSLPVLVLR